MRTLEDMVRQEVIMNVGTLVNTLAKGYGTVAPGSENAKELNTLTEQAMELAAPIDDWEEPAREAGYVLESSADHPGTFEWVGPDGDREGYFDTEAEAWRAACGDGDVIDPYAREVFEFWAVDPWLARKLEARGEKVDPDFEGFAVWARTTTGQAISLDSVIREIYAESKREFDEITGK